MDGLFHSLKGGVGAELEAAGVTVRYLNASGYLGMLLALPELIGETRRVRPHMLQGWMYHGNIAATMVARMIHSNVPVIWNILRSLP